MIVAHFIFILSHIDSLFTVMLTVTAQWSMKQHLFTFCKQNKVL